MRIKQLDLVGFKSFPQRTSLEIPSGVTAVVGPNGCGKSNVVDAIRWVLGEQSPKQLRGDAMEAVIFNGNDRLAPLGMAEVSLTFENGTPAASPSELDLELSTIPAHFRNLTEIMISRRYFRSGESEYFINKTPCRLKDITELFLGTGVGSKAYAVVEQGRVEQLINAKPEDRRLFIEEAAGTTLYRSRKLAAERKMGRARENLHRVNDVLREIERQVQYLRRQAKKAETYRRLADEVRRIELGLAGRQWDDMQSQLATLDAEWGRLVAQDERLRAALSESEQAQQAAGAALSASEQRQAARRESLAVLEAERESVRERVQFLTQERDERERRRARLAEDLQANRAASSEIAQRLRQLEHEREAAARQLALDEVELGGQENDLAAARAAIAEMQAHLDAAKGNLVEHVTRAAEARNGLIAVQRRREDLARRLDKLRAEETALDLHLLEIDRQANGRRGDLEALRAELASATGEQETRADELRSLAEARRSWQRRATECEGELLQARSRLESLEQIQSNYEGFERGVRAIMRDDNQTNGVLGVVADVIDIPQEYERAVAAVLGERLQYVIVRGEEEGAGAVDRLREQASGRGSFIPLHPRLYDLNGTPSPNGSSQRLLDLVRVDGSFRLVAESLLGDVVLMPDLKSAVAAWRQNGVRLTLVTPEGDVMDPSGVITGGSDRPVEEEIIARRREIDALRNGAESAHARLEGVRAEAHKVALAVDEAEEALKAVGQGAHELTVRIVAAEKDMERLEIERPQCTSRRDVTRYEIEGLVAEERTLADEETAVRSCLQELTDQHQVLEREVAQCRESLDDTIAGAEALATQVTAMKVRVAERRERQQAAAAAVDTGRKQEAELVERERAIAAEVASSEGERDELERSIEAALRREAEQSQRRSALQAEVDGGAREVHGLAEALREAEKKTREVQGSLDETRSQRNQVELARSEVRLRAEHLAESMRERYGCDVAAVDRHEVEGADPADESARLEVLKNRLGRLGEVNMTAIDELRELEERDGFLRAQRDDLERSLADLERTIHKLNRASRTRFAETFARANETFQKVFPRLFRGGEGRLVLTDEHNLLETGVDIIVRPPGKRLDSVSLLSGGEKALVAVSLIFSLFLINPTPFCILDEVDAPLDDVNIGRFSGMIREMSSQSQFVIITHNKRTMEAADILYGVTMQEPGVSKVISVTMS